jgi:hypothetical protein
MNSPNAARTRAITFSQARAPSCRTNHIVGYQGLSVQSSSQRLVMLVQRMEGITAIAMADSKVWPERERAIEVDQCCLAFSCRS